MAQETQTTNTGTATGGEGGGQSSENQAYDYKTGVAPEYHSMWEAKGWTSPNDALKSYANLENMLSAQNRLVLPSSDEDKNAWGELYNKLGRPAKAEDYKFEDMPEGQQRNEDLAKWMKQNAHELGLSQKQAAGLEKNWNMFSQELAGKIAQAEKAAADAELEGLKRQWGADYEDKMIAAKNAAKSLGGDKIGSVIDALASHVGLAETVTFFNGLAQKMGDPNFVASDHKGGGAGGMTPESAKREIATLQADPDYLSPLTNPARHAELQRRAQELFAQAYPDDLDTKSKSFSV